MDSLYQAHILEHYKHPHNKRIIDDADLVHRGKNVSCGDDLTWYIKWEEGDMSKVADASFEGYGCAISQSAASILSDKLAGLSKEEMLALTRDDIIAMLHVDISPMREKCALLALSTLKEMLNR